ncbi:MAG: hypothetical protein CME71_00320 [Halobacteriovorax sp.]|nr:hypothetical protein [Halobacteriovorax sp.]|tara:strand:- start:1252 stop:1560 length:309 start_codon:yes stop_codon:yes gene_type:complete
MEELHILSNCILNNLSKNGQLLEEHDQYILDATKYGLDEVIFAICKVLIDMGLKNQEENNEIALSILSRSISDAISQIKQENGRFQKLFYSWINSQEDGENI